MNRFFGSILLLGVGANSAWAGCPPNLFQSVQQLNPDIVVVLGAGFQSSGLPARHSRLRAATARRIFLDLRARPELLFSGGVRAAHRTLPPTPRELNCMIARLGNANVPPHVRPSALTEADVLCGLAGIDDRFASRLWFEPYSLSTVGNAHYSAARIAHSPTLSSAAKVLVVTSQVMRRGRVVDDHALRAFRAFKARLPSSVQVSSLGCTPDGERGSRLVTE